MEGYLEIYLFNSRKKRKEKIVSIESQLTTVCIFLPLPAGRQASDGDAARRNPLKSDHRGENIGVGRTKGGVEREVRRAVDE